MASYHGKNDAQDRKHPQPPQRPSSVIGVPKGSMPTGGRKTTSPAYATPARSRPNANAHEHQENVTAQAGSFPNIGTFMAGQAPVVNTHTQGKFDQRRTQPDGSGQSFPYGSSQKSVFGFDRLRGGQ